MENRRSGNGMGAGQSLDGVKVVPLVFKYVLSSDGTDNWRYIDLDLPQIRSWGPHLMEIIVHTLAESQHADLEWKAVLYFSIDALGWVGPVDISGVVGTNGQVIHTAFTNRQNFGLNIRIALAVRNKPSANNTNVLNATVTAAGAFDFRR